MDSNSLSFLQKPSLLVAEKKKQTFMKANLFYGIVAVAIFIGVVACCEKEMDEIVPPVQDEQNDDDNQGTPPKKDTIVIDTTKKTTINEIVYFEENKFMVVGTNDWYRVGYGNGRWVAGGIGGNIATSTDNGASWSTQTFGSYTWWVAVYGNNRWVMGGNGW